MNCISGCFRNDDVYESASHLGGSKALTLLNFDGIKKYPATQQPLGGGPVCFHHWKLPSNMNLTLKTISVTKAMLQAMNFQLNQLFFPFFSQSFWSAAIMFWVVLVSSTV